MSKVLEKELDEAKATGEDSVAADAVVGAGGPVKKRKGDLDKDASATQPGTAVKTPEGSNNVGLKEAVDSLFEGTDLSEDFKVKTVAIFEAAVHARAETIREELETKFESDLAEQAELISTELSEKVDAYLNYVTEQWMNENNVEIESNIKVTVAESLISSLKGLISEHNIDMDEETVDHIKAVETNLDEANIRINSLVEEMISLKEEKAAAERVNAFNTVSEGLTDTQVDKLRALSESVSYGNVEEYRSKVVALKEGYFSTLSKVAPHDETEMLNEAVEDDIKVVIDPTINRYVSAISRSISK